MELEKISRTFAIWDYVVFGAMLGISAIIGIYYAIVDRHKNVDTEGYLMAGRSMGTVPVALSLTVSFMSAITVLGTPSEVYRFGTMYFWTLLAMLFVVCAVSLIYIPAFYNLGISSTYEYLEQRFSKPVRILATVVFIAQNVLYIGIVIYAPGLALNQVTGFSLWGSVVATGVVCTFYTTLGGLKAVIWTDVFQSVVMCGGFIAIIVKGSIDMGGFANIWEINRQGGRIDFVHFEGDMHIRNTFWSFIVGGTITWMGIYGVSQSQVQRYLCCKSERDAKIALFLNWLGLVVIICFAIMSGLVLYASYSTCDPLATGCVGAADQLLPFLVMEMFEGYPGIPGLFVACVYSGSLSTVSSGINAMATVALEDFIKPHTSHEASTYTWISKGLVVVFGIVCLGMAYLASTLGGVLEAALSIFGMLGGPLVGLFTLGLMIPFANATGAFVSTVCGLGFSIWVYIGGKEYPPGPELVRPLYLENNCTATCYELRNTTTDLTTTNIFTTTVPSTTTVNTATTTLAEEPAITSLYHVSYLYLSFLGFSAVFGLGIIISLLTCGWRDRKKTNPKLIMHCFDLFIFRWIPLRFRKMMRCGVDVEESKQNYYFDVKTSANDVTIEKYRPNEVITSPPSYSERNGQSNPGYDVDDDTSQDGYETVTPIPAETTKI